MKELLYRGSEGFKGGAGVEDEAVTSALRLGTQPSRGPGLVRSQFSKVNRLVIFQASRNRVV